MARCFVGRGGTRGDLLHGSVRVIDDDLVGRFSGISLRRITPIAVTTATASKALSVTAMMRPAASARCEEAWRMVSTGSH